MRGESTSQILSLAPGWDYMGLCGAWMALSGCAPCLDFVRSIETDLLSASAGYDFDKVFTIRRVRYRAFRLRSEFAATTRGVFYMTFTTHDCPSCQSLPRDVISEPTG